MTRSLVLEALVEPRRRDILRLIRSQELAAGEIARHFDVTRGAVSQHIGVLKAAGLVAERREGTRRLYRVRIEGFAELREFLDEFWNDRLARLQQAAERSDKGRSAKAAGGRSKRSAPRAERH